MSNEWIVMRIMKPTHIEVIDCPDSIDIELSALNERQALENHSQSLTKLAGRGGLSACEAVGILEHKLWPKMTPQDAINRLNQLTKGE
ncbi:MAG: hypothetical protein GY774_17555 [Planctomycetes bacterium]|nr:hypothetical protein [Planctomycetota bacterium]